MISGRTNLGGRKRLAGPAAGRNPYNGQPQAKGMRLSALLASLTLVALLFAGCSGDGDGGSTSTSSSATRSSAASSSTSRSSTATTTSTGTTTTAAPANQPPTGSMSASINGTDVAFTLTGADADGDDLSWELDFGDGSGKATGMDLPANVAHTYAVGNHTANFTLSDGTDATSYEVPVTVAAAGGGAAVQDVDFGYAVGGIMCADAPPAMVFGTPAADVFWSEWEILAETVGTPYLVEFTAANPALAIGEIAFYNDADEQIDVNAAVSPVTGTVPAGAVHAMFVDCAAGAIEGHYHAG